MTKRKSITVWDVAQAANVSAQTVSRVLSGKGYASEETKAKVRAAADTLGYKQNLLGKSLRSALSPIVGLVVADVTNPFYARLHRSLEHHLRESGLSVFLLNCDDDPDEESTKLELLAAYSPTGLVISPAAGSHFDSAAHAKFRNVVFVSRTLPNLAVPTVQTNERESFAQAAQELFDNGHLTVAAVLGRSSVSTTVLREAGLMDAVASNPGRRAIVRYADGTAEQGFAQTQELLGAEPELSGIIGFNGPVTEGILGAIRSAELEYPGDISVIGFTDAGWMSASSPSITAVAQPVEAMGRRAGELIVRMARGEAIGADTHIIEDSELTRRESVTAPSTRKAKL